MACSGRAESAALMIVVRARPLMPGVGRLRPLNLERNKRIMELKNWCLITFEVDETPQNADIHPDLIEQVREVYFAQDYRHPDFCIALRRRVDGEKILRDYYLSPMVLQQCGRLLIHHSSVEFCEEPTGPNLVPVAGCESIARRRS
jgi:hypothetical protein